MSKKQEILAAFRERFGGSEWLQGQVGYNTRMGIENFLSEALDTIEAEARKTGFEEGAATARRIFKLAELKLAQEKKHENG